MARNNKTCAPPYSARKDSCEFSTAGVEDTKCSPAGHPTFGQLAEIEAFVAQADRPLSTSQECGFHTTRPRPSNTTFKTLANGSRQFDQRDREWKGSGSLPEFMPVMVQIHGRRVSDAAASDSWCAGRVQDHRWGQILHPQVVSIHGLCRNRRQIGRSEKTA